MGEFWTRDTHIHTEGKDIRKINSCSKTNVYFAEHLKRGGRRINMCSEEENAWKTRRESGAVEWDEREMIDRSAIKTQLWAVK